MLKKSLLFLVGLMFSVLTYAQNAFVDIPLSYWDNFNVEEVLQQAKDGNAEAQFTIALYYSVVEHDNGKFRTWIEKAAAQNNADALCMIAQCYAVGDYGFVRDGAKALQYARQSAILNNTQAIGMMYEACRWGLFGAEKDDIQAFYWAGKGARLGDAYCQFWTGIMLRLGIGCKQDRQMTLFWLQKSADQQYIEAQACLIIHYGYLLLDEPESSNNIFSIGADFLMNPQVNQDTESILLAKGFLGFVFFEHKHYKEGIRLMRAGLRTQNEQLQFLWQVMNEYARDVLGTTINALENQY